MTEAGNPRPSHRPAAYDQLPAPTPIGHQLREIVSLSSAFEKQLGRTLGCNPTDLAAMSLLIDHGPMAPSQLAKELGVSTAAATMVVDRLAALGHAKRRAHGTDRRKVEVVPAPASIEAAVRELMPVITGVDSAIARLSEQEREVVQGFLAQVIDIYAGALT